MPACAAIQFSPAGDKQSNLDIAEHWVEKAKLRGAQIVLLPELFAGAYFPQKQDPEFFARAETATNSQLLSHCQLLARQFSVVMPVSFFERDNTEYYNSVAMIDATGEVLGVYRKAHIPDGPGYQEKYYFRPGNTGFRVWKTKYATIGVGICWDQWFPECARAMVLQGADILFYPTAIGSEPEEPHNDTKDPWQRAMVGHAVSNVVGVVCANRVGKEKDIEFYGSSFIANCRGDLIDSLDRTSEGIVVGSFDLEQMALDRASWGFFRDRRPDLYGSITQANVTVNNVNSANSANSKTTNK